MTNQTNAQRLAEYEVIVLFDASSSVTVMAESPEEAAGKAEELTSGNQQLCHQCSNTLETGDAIGCIVYKDDELVAETDWKSQRITDLETANAQLRAELEAVRRDAERYRWLRTQDDDDFCFAVVKNPHFDVYQSPEELDAAIDAAKAMKGGAL